MLRDILLVQQMSPCDTNIYDTSIRTISDAKSKGKDFCPHYPKCKELNIAGGSAAAGCTLRFGVSVAQYVSSGSTLEAELEELRGSGLFKNRTFVDSLDRKNFEMIRGNQVILTRVSEIAKYLLA